MAESCSTCFHRCRLEEGQAGFCRARVNRDGHIVPSNYGRITALALDPIEKKPLARFLPGSRILSLGSWGCNMRCAFCQNYHISQFGDEELRTEPLSPEELVNQASALQSRGNIGVAYTYNEPLIAWEYVRDCAKLVHEAGMKNVIVTNGCVLPPVLEAVLPFTDAMNIDLKCFSASSYSKLGGDFESVKTAIALCHGRCHLELTTLIVPGFNDGEEEMAEEAAWIASIDRGIPLHVTRFFPRWQMTDRASTPVARLYRLADVAKRELTDVLVGNV